MRTPFCTVFGTIARKNESFGEFTEIVSSGVDIRGLR